MITCPKCKHQNEHTAENCANCDINLDWALRNYGKIPEEIAKEQAELKKRLHSLIVTTTYSIEGRSIAQYLDVVTAEVVLGTGFLSELEGGITDFLGVRSEAFQSKFRKAKNFALQELRKEAAQKGADAVVGTDVDFTILRKNMLMVSANGTAVKLAPIQRNIEMRREVA